MDQTIGNRELWLVLLGAMLNKDHDRDELAGMFDIGDAPPDVSEVMQAIADKKRGPVLQWLKSRGVEMGNGKTPIRAVSEKVTITANDHWWTKQQFRLKGVSVKEPSEAIRLVEVLLNEMRDRLGVSNGRDS